MFSLLRDNVHINWCERVVDIMNVAVSESSGTLTLYRRIGRSGNTSIINSDGEELTSLGEIESEAFSIDAVSLDDYSRSLDRVDIVKIDVEGAESLVVNGMEQMIERHRPTIVMEWSPSQTVQAGFKVDELADRFRILDMRPHRIGPDGTLSAVSHSDVPHLSYQNLVFLPAGDQGS
jgi:FkbM family methyltransferase